MNISTDQVLHMYVVPATKATAIVETATEGTLTTAELLVKGANANNPTGYIKIGNKKGPNFSTVKSIMFKAGGNLKKGQTTLTAKDSFEAKAGYYYSLTLKYSGFAVADANLITVTVQAATNGDDVIKALGDALKAEVDATLVDKEGVPVLTVTTAEKQVIVEDEDPIYDPITYKLGNIKCVGLEVTCEEMLPHDAFEVAITNINSATKNGAQYASMEHFAMGERGGQTNLMGWPYYHNKYDYAIDPNKNYKALVLKTVYFGDGRDYHSTECETILLAEA